MWTAPPERIRLGGRVDSRPKAGAHQMNQIARIGLDIAKRWFQVQAVDGDGREILNRKLPLDKVLGFLAALSPLDVALEACSSSHYWGREIGSLGHRVRLISPSYVKPYLKRGKSDAHDARAICVRRPLPRGARKGAQADCSRSRRDRRPAARPSGRPVLSRLLPTYCRSMCSAAGICWRPS